MIPPKVYEFCRNGVSVSSESAKQPDVAPSVISKKVFGFDIEDDVVEDLKASQESNEISDLDRVSECGQWGKSRPSELFLQIYHDVLRTIDRKPTLGVCSPSLIGSNGVCPLTIISTIPDIARHMSNLIARAEHEVFLATNFWMISEPSRLISNAIRELSKNAVAQKKRIVVKIIYDRAGPKQLVKNHAFLQPKDYADPNGKIQLPNPDELPNLDLEVINYHKPMFGTFHAKYMVVDRRIAVIQSNNIQDNDNLEMMTQWEGPIVDSLYDTALISWHNEMTPPLPCLNSPAASAPLPTFEGPAFATLFNDRGELVPVYQGTDPVPNGDTSLSQIATHGAQISRQQHTPTNPHYDPDIPSEVLRAVATLNPLSSETRINAITRLLNTSIQPNTKGNAPDIPPAQAFTPLIPHKPHRPVPIAVVNREPYGSPSLSSLHVPQNAAFLAALAHAKSHVYIQTPNLNAADLLPAILAAARRGVHVTYTYCLGYNDAGEMLPFQGGHNESVANRLLTELEEQHHDNLDIYTYIAKDQTRPIHNSFKQRSCHIKLMTVDDHIGIQGSGNQDTQSWYHSQEINLLIDSPEIVARWMEGIRMNQNTFIYGKVQKTGPMAGCWIDDQGKMVEHAVGVDPGKFSWAKGLIGAVQRVRGAGGF